MWEAHLGECPMAVCQPLLTQEGIHDSMSYTLHCVSYASPALQVLHVDTP
jgi:hypothetical protein